jgi:hypothetical protein
VNFYFSLKGTKMQLLRNEEDYKKFIIEYHKKYDIEESEGCMDIGEEPPKEYPCMVDVIEVDKDSPYYNYIYRQDVAPLFESEIFNLENQ